MARDAARLAQYTRLACYTPSRAVRTRPATNFSSRSTLSAAILAALARSQLLQRLVMRLRATKSKRYSSPKTPLPFHRCRMRPNKRGEKAQHPLQRRERAFETCECVHPRHNANILWRKGFFTGEEWIARRGFPQGLGLRIEGLGVRVSGLGCLGFRVRVMVRI